MLAVYGSSTLPLLFPTVPQTTHPIITWKQEKCWRSGELKARQIKHHRQLLAGARGVLLCGYKTDRSTYLSTYLNGPYTKPLTVWLEGKQILAGRITHRKCDMTIEILETNRCLATSENDWTQRVPLTVFSASYSPFLSVSLPFSISYSLLWLTIRWDAGQGIIWCKKKPVIASHTQYLHWPKRLTIVTDFTSDWLENLKRSIFFGSWNRR
jgi:hypothetical protein